MLEADHSSYDAPQHVTIPSRYSMQLEAVLLVQTSSTDIYAN